MGTLDLPDAYLRQVLALIDGHAPGAEVWAYGSRTAGTAHATSDLDLVLRSYPDPRQPVPTLSRLRNAFSESDLPILVEVLDWARIPEALREEIGRRHVVLLTAAPDNHSG